MIIKNYTRLMRLNQPTGIWLLFLPCLFGIFLAAKKTPNFSYEFIWTIFLFFVGSIVMRSAGCIINDICDHKFDSQVERTKSRPIASGEISLKSATILLAFLLIIALVILLQFNLKTVLGGAFSLILVATYPLMKRVTFYPQIFLGLTFNFGIILGSLALRNEIDLATITLYFAAMIWTVIYDTIYAYQDIDDDIKIGIKSTAIKFKNNPQKALLFLNLLMFTTMILLGWQSKFRAEFFMAILLADLALTHKIKSCDFQNSKKCLQTFKSNIWVGVIILSAIILG